MSKKAIAGYGDYGNKSPKIGSGRHSKAANPVTSSRVQVIGGKKVVGWDDIPKDRQHLYTQIGRSLYLLDSLSDSSKLKFGSTPHGDDGAMACVRSGCKIGGHLRIMHSNITQAMPTPAPAEDSK